MSTQVIATKASWNVQTKVQMHCNMYQIMLQTLNYPNAKRNDQGEETFPGKYFQLNVITSLIWQFFSNGDFLSLICCKFSRTVYFWRSYFSPFLKITTSIPTFTFLEHLFFQNICIFWGAPFPEQWLFRGSFFFQNSYFFRAKLLPSNRAKPKLLPKLLPSNRAKPKLLPSNHFLKIGSFLKHYFSEHLVLAGGTV